jgi:hypothetical protein
MNIDRSTRIDFLITEGYLIQTSFNLTKCHSRNFANIRQDISEKVLTNTESKIGKLGRVRLRVERREEAEVTKS